MTPQSRVFATPNLLITRRLRRLHDIFLVQPADPESLLRDREWLYAGGNILLSVLLCMIAVWLGYLLGNTFNSMKGH